MLLVVDDDRAICRMIAVHAAHHGFGVIACEDGREALHYLELNSADLALVDLQMPHVGGLDVLRTIRQTDPHCQVVLMSGGGTIPNAVEAIKLGARDWLEKPFDMAMLGDLLDTVKAEMRQHKQVATLQHQLAQQFNFAGMIGRSAVMRELFGLVQRLAPHVKTVLITGETGTGKELVAKALHQWSPRRDRPFRTLSCAGFDTSLAESDLLGHVQGAFPGATSDRAGAFELADGGVLFIDEIGELPVAVQSRLIRILDHRTTTRLGSLDERNIDVVVVAATSRDLRTEMMTGRFRRDLHARLAGAEIHLPALRERKDDIPYLATAFVHDCAVRFEKPLVGLTAPAETLLLRREWTGNVRQLRSVIERACMAAAGEFVTERELVSALKQTPA